MNLHIKTILFGLFLLNTISLYANQRPYIINISKDRYKAANKNWAVAQDEKGCMYFANDLGLIEFDGMRWQNYNLPHSPLIRAVAAASHDVIFTGGFEEFGVWKRDSFGKLNYQSLTGLLKNGSLENENFWKVWVSEQYVYFQTFKNIYAYDYERVEPLTPGNGFLFLLKVGDEYLVQETFGSIYRVEGTTLVQLPGSERFSKDVVRVILPYHAGGYLIGASNGNLQIYENGNYREWNRMLSQELQGKELNCAVYSASRNIYYLGTLIDGVYEVDHDGTILQHYSFKNYLKNNTVLSLFEDADSNIWMAMDRGLAYMRYDPGMSYFRSTRGDAGAVYDAVFWNEQLYIGTNQGVYSIPRARMNDYAAFSNLKLIEGTQGQVWSIREEDGRLLVGHNRGLIEIDRKGEVREPYVFNTGVFRVLPVKIKGRELQIVSTYKNIWVIDKKAGRKYMMQQIKEPVAYIEMDHMDNLWMSTFSGGVYKARFENDFLSFRYLSYYDKRSHPELPTHLNLFKLNGRLFFLGSQNVWSYDESQNRFEPETALNACFQSLDRFKKLMPLHHDYNWLITASSVHKFYYDGHEARITYSRKLNSGGLSLITESENIAVLNDSVSLICLDEGFILHTSQDRVANEQRILPVPELTAITMESEKKEFYGFAPGMHPEIPYRFHNLTFSFLIKGAFAHNLFVQYKLDEVDSEWSLPVKANQVSYDRLPAGEKSLWIRSTDGMGNYSESTKYTFRILNPWYRSVFAMVCYLCILLALFVLTWFLIKRHYKKDLIRKLREQESMTLRKRNMELMHEIEAKNAELLTQTSFIIQKNELIMKLKGMVDEFCVKNAHKSLTSVSHKMNSVIENNMDTQEDWKMFLLKFEEKHTGFFKKLKEMYPQLTNNDLRLCACLKLNMDTKDIASLMCISVRAVENNRYRIRKKLDIPSAQNLNEYFVCIE
ncbi:MAG: hypothetical protein RSE51_03330 [Bacteroidales bacterium]